MKSPILWMVRAGEGAYLVEDFLSKGIVAIGWNEAGNLSAIKDLGQIKERLKVAYPNVKPSQINNYAGQIYRFRVEFHPEHLVVTYNPSERIYHIGEINSDYIWDEELTDFFNVRRVKWTRKVSRDDLSTKTKNSLGAIQTLFLLPGFAANELLGIVPAPATKVAFDEDQIEEEVTLDTIKEDFEAKALEFIKDKIQQLDWEDMQELTAGILRGMGYKTLVSPKGADRGKDIMASPDGLGLENPKIKVEVKHRSGAMGSSDIRNFIGGLRPTDRGLYVSTGGFSKEAKYEAERANVPLTLIDTELLVQLIIQHYDQFDSETRALMPLKKIYWPV